ncbi:hypothetical protein ACODM8_04830 [Vibrio ostreicida]|uniref:cyanobactin maturation protease PatG family protein n=1 Tax=Vibrio ostreicida TaxID=526588 RepID=UPI000970BC5F|nr:hypothetical protein [Vibrio ostreicida]
MSIKLINASTGNAYVYALGDIRPYLATRDLQKEFEAATKALGCADDDYYRVFSYQVARGNTEDLTFRPYAYIAEKADWVFTINEIDTYMIVPKYVNELDALIAALNKQTDASSVALVGTMGVQTTDNDLRLPSVVCNHVLTQPVGDKTPITIKPNDGLSASRRALNYLVFNFNDLLKDKPNIEGQLIEINYQTYFKAQDRVLIEMILTYRNQSLEESYSCGIDVTDEYPFIDFPLRSYVPKAA